MLHARRTGTKLCVCARVCVCVCVGGGDNFFSIHKNDIGHNTITVIMYIGVQLTRQCDYNADDPVS